MSHFLEQACNDVHQIGDLLLSTQRSLATNGCPRLAEQVGTLRDDAEALLKRVQQEWEGSI
jgi:hypothetical protein